MKCSILGLKPGLKYAFLQPFGATINKGQVALVPEAKADIALRYNHLALEKVGETEVQRLKNGGWELASAEILKAKTVSDEPKMLPNKSDKSMSGKKKTKNKKA